MEMTSRKIRALSVAVAAVALVTTLAVARTVHTPSAPTDQATNSQGKVTGTAPAQSKGSHLHGIITCGTATSAQDCEKLEMLLPMNWSKPDSVTPSVRI
jgi:PhoPQ-activated pathogenicity-related protein